MLSEREKRLIELEGEKKYHVEIIHELLGRDDLDEFEQAVLRTAIDNLKEIKQEIEELMKG